MGVITMVIIFVCLNSLFVIYIACYDFTHKKLLGTKKPPANLIARSKEQKWEECGQQKVVQRDKECIFFPRANCVVIFVYSFRLGEIELTMYSDTNFNPRSSSEKILE